MTDSGTPEAEVEIDTILLRNLLRDPMPTLGAERIEWLDTGGDDVSFRVGSEEAWRVAIGTKVRHDRLLDSWRPACTQWANRHFDA